MQPISTDTDGQLAQGAAGDRLSVDQAEHELVSLRNPVPPEAVDVGQFGLPWLPAGCAHLDRPY